MLCIVGFDGFFRAVNPAFEKRLGIPQAELTAEPWLSWVHPDDAAATQAAIEQLSPNHSPITLDTRLRHSDGTYTFYQWTVTYDPAGIYAVVQPSESISPFETLNNWLIDAPAGIIVLHGREQFITLVNYLYEKISGHTRAQLVGRKLREVWPELYEQGIGAIFDGIFASGQAFISHEFYARFDHTGEGVLEEGYFDFVAQPVKDRDGQVTDIFIHLYEVTDYVRAREKLVEGEEQFRAIVNQSVVGIAEKDLSGRYILVNDRFCEMVGYSRDELLTKRLHDITHPDDLPRNAFLFEQMINEGKNVIIEKRYVRKDGSIIWVQNTMLLVRDANGDKQYALEMSFDLTSIKAAEEALMERQREKAVLEERQRLARELHDSVTQSLFSAGVITESISHIVRHQPDKALTQLDHLGSLIRGASAELRTLLWELRPDKIAQAGLASLLTQLAYSVQARKSLKVFLRVHGDYEQPLPPDVLMAFYRIAQESINNIIKHSDATRIKIMMRRTETYVMMDILDDGLGFDNSSGKSGFGLMIMRERAEEAGARLDIFSGNGKGTRVRLFWQGKADTNVVSIE
ncbi:MAG: PAS domain S-box protein [Anaerolineae bacterium]|nr:PAS domain S-box protein [Anaerolineae bacterium]